MPFHSLRDWWSLHQRHTVTVDETDLHLIPHAFHVTQKGPTFYCQDFSQVGKKWEIVTVNAGAHGAAVMLLF